MPRIRTVRAFSAGGVLYRRRPHTVASGIQADTATGPVPDDVDVVLVGSAAEDFWVLPKGTPRVGESTAEVALREVEEETGVRGRIVGELGSIHYWFSRDSTRYNKEVVYFLMEAVSGDVSLHDHEYDDARWFPLPEACRRLAYANQAEMTRAAAHALWTQRAATTTDV